MLCANALGFLSIQYILSCMTARAQPEHGSVKKNDTPFNVLLSPTNIPRLRGFLLILCSLRVKVVGPGAAGAQLNPLFSSWQQQHPCTSLIHVGPVYYVPRIAESSSPRLWACSLTFIFISTVVQKEMVYCSVWYIFLSGHLTAQAEL